MLSNLRLLLPLALRFHWICEPPLVGSCFARPLAAWSSTLAFSIVVFAQALGGECRGGPPWHPPDTAQDT